MRVVYFGTAEFAVAPLRAIANHVVLVVAQPDRHSGRGMRLQPTPVHSAAIELGLPFVSPERCRDPEFFDTLQELQPDVLVVAAYGQIMPVRLFETARNGGINLHGSILPKYRGAAPIQRAIMAGEKETGVTLMQMDKGMDTGDMIDIARVMIDPDETYGELQARLSATAATQIAEWLPRLCTGQYPRNPQDHNQATHAAKITKEDGEIRIENDAREEYNRFRAVTPAPGAWIAHETGPVKILRASRSGVHAGRGKVEVLPGDAGLHLGIGDRTLCLELVQPAGRKPTSGRDFANGTRLKSGDTWPSG